MGMYLTLWVFKGVDVDQLRAEFESATACFGGWIRWGAYTEGKSADCRMARAGDTVSVYMPYLGGEATRLCAAVGARLRCVWMEARIQEGSHWDYALHRGAECISLFSALPEYWDDDPTRIARWRGDPSILASAWGIPQERINRYLRAWGYVQIGDFTCDYLVKDKAYPDDQYSAGEYDQLWDFLRALGAPDPMPAAGPDLHALHLPRPARPQVSAWRRWRFRAKRFLGPRRDPVCIAGDDGVRMITTRRRRFWWFG